MDSNVYTSQASNRSPGRSLEGEILEPESAAISPQTKYYSGGYNQQEAGAEDLRKLKKRLADTDEESDNPYFKKKERSLSKKKKKKKTKAKKQGNFETIDVA